MRLRIPAPYRLPPPWLRSRRTRFRTRTKPEPEAPNPFRQLKTAKAMTGQTPLPSRNCPKRSQPSSGSKGHPRCAVRSLSSRPQSCYVFRWSSSRLVICCCCRGGGAFRRLSCGSFRSSPSSLSSSSLTGCISGWTKRTARQPEPMPTRAENAPEIPFRAPFPFHRGRGKLFSFVLCPLKCPFPPLSLRFGIVVRAKGRKRPKRPFLRQSPEGVTAVTIWQSPSEWRAKRKSPTAKAIGQNLTFVYFKIFGTDETREARAFGGGVDVEQTAFVLQFLYVAARRPG